MPEVKEDVTEEERQIYYALKRLKKRIGAEGKEFAEGFNFFPELKVVHIQQRHGCGDIVHYREQTDNRNPIIAMKWLLRNGCCKEYIKFLDDIIPLLEALNGQRIGSQINSIIKQR